jgi:hypothetical protein
MGRACRNRVLGPYEFFLAFLDCESQLLALRDISLGCRIGSLSEQSGHGPTCCRLNSVGNDPQRTFATVS